MKDKSGTSLGKVETEKEKKIREDKEDWLRSLFFIEPYCHG